VISYYHLAFFAISMAMFGMTAGSLIVYFNQALFMPERLLGHLSWIASAFAVTTVLSAVILISTVLLDPSIGILLSAMLWLKLIVALVPPYIFAGMGISLALTRSPWPVGLVYGWARCFCPCRTRLQFLWQYAHQKIDRGNRADRAARQSSTSIGRGWRGAPAVKREADRKSSTFAARSLGLTELSTTGRSPSRTSLAASAGPRRAGLHAAS